MTQNVLTRLIPDLYQDLDVVSRELVGFLPSVNRNSSAARAAIGESVVVPISTVKASKDTNVSMTLDEPDAFETSNEIIMITKSRTVDFGVTGEEWTGLNNGVGVDSVLGGNIKQAIRTLTNEMEGDIAAAAAIACGRAVGTAGTTPFADGTTKDFALTRQGLNDMGAPLSGRSLVVDGDAGVNILGIDNLIKANEAGTTMTLRQGEMANVFGLSIKETHAVSTVGGSSVSGLTLVAAEKGATQLEVKAVTSGSLVAGDVITIAGDSTKYVVQAAVTLAVGATIELARSGLKQAVAESSAVTVAAASARNIAFTQEAIQLVTRAPALPGGDDAAVDSYMLTDPRSGMAFEIRVYKGKRKMSMEVSAAWGVKVIKPEHVVTLLG